nr:hypothetical protein [Tanacetum cinerariifolium]
RGFELQMDQFVAVSTPISAAKPAAKPKVLKIVAAAPAVSTKKRKGVVIRDPEEELHDDTPAETLSVKDKGKGILVKDPKPMKKKDQIEMDAEYSRKLQEELDKENEESFKKINWNTAFDHVQAKDVQAKGTHINETPAQKAAKRRRLREQAKEDEDLKKQLEVVVDEDDDVFIEATQLVEREDLEDLWKIVKVRFSTSKPTNFFDDYLLATLKTMFEKIDAQDVTWRSQQTEYGQALVKSWKLLTSCGVHIITFTTTMFVLLVEKRYLLSRFTLEQLVNVARLQKRSKENTKCVTAAGEELTAAKHKLILLVVAASTPIPSAKPAVVAVSTPISAAKPAAKPKVLKIIDATPAVSTRKRKGVVIRDPEEELHDDTPAETLSVKDKGKENEESFKKINWNTAFDHVQAKDVQAKGTQYIKRYHGFKKKPQSESEARKNMIAYLKNTKGFNMAFFKGKTYDQILLIFQARFDANLIFLFKSREEMEKEEEEIIKNINETPAQKAAKRRRLRKQAKEDEDLKNSWREDLEDLWKIVKVRFSTSKPTNFFDDYLLATLKTMFEKTDAQDVIWRSQQTEYGQALGKS